MPATDRWCRPAAASLADAGNPSHHGDPSLRAVVVIVAEPQRVAHFMRGELPYAGKGRPIEDIGLLAARRVWRQQAFEDEIVLTVAQRAERDRALDDLAGARIADRAAE